MADKRKWNADEEALLAEYFRECKKQHARPNPKEAERLLESRGVTNVAVLKVKAKIGDLARVDRGESLSHVAAATIRAYREAFKDEPNALLEMLGYVPKFEVETAASELLDGLSLGETFSEKLNRLIKRIEWDSGFKITWSQIYTHAEVNHTTANELRSGERVKIKCEHLFRLFIEMRLSLDQARELMEAAGLSFRDGECMDSVVALALKKGIYDKKVINAAMIKACNEPLFPRFHRTYTGA